ncbi:MAG: rpmC [Gammaproteobacteria bacterium]|nr:rpmC [Gammaproteobacteria bacterium]
MNVEEFRKMTSPQLNEELMALLRKQFNLRMQKGSGQEPKSSEVRAVRKDIARLKTVLREMQK